MADLSLRGRQSGTGAGLTGQARQHKRAQADNPGDDIASSCVAASTGDLGRVLFVTSNFPRWPGDATTPFVLHLAQDLQALGWAVEVLAPHAPGAARQEVLEGVLVHRFRYFWPEDWQSVCYQGGALVNLRQERLNWLKLPALVFFEIWALFRLARRGTYDAIHAHWVLPQGFVAVLVGRLLKIPVVITVHGGDVFALRGRVMRWFKRFSFRRAQAVTVNSSATGTVVRQLVPNYPALHRIPMGAAIPPPPDREELKRIRAAYRRAAGPLLLFVGRLVEEKGLGDLIEALTLLQAKRPDATLLVLGEGQERKRFERQVSAHGLAGSVHFLGWVQPVSLPAYMTAADIFVAPSKTGQDGWTEGQGLSIVEAMLCGTPVVASRSGGIVDTISDGETGLLVEEADPQAIAGAIRRYLSDPDRMQAIAEAGSKRARRDFTRDGSAMAFGEVYASKSMPVDGQAAEL